MVVHHNVKCVLAEVGDHLARASEGPLGVDHPLLAVELAEDAVEGCRGGKTRGAPGQVEPSVLAHPSQAAHEDAAEQAAHQAYWEQEARV